VALGFGVITYAHLVFGEQAPEVLSPSRGPSGSSLWISRPLNLFRLVLRPVVWVVNASTNFILRPGASGSGRRWRRHSEEELRIMISSSTASGVLEPEEREYLNNVFDFGDRVARESWCRGPT
jgi:CBS domain containing-hemolysin-like protein